MWTDNFELAKCLADYQQHGFWWQLTQPDVPKWLLELVHDCQDGKEIVCKAECNHRNECPLDLKRRSDNHQQPIPWCKIEQIACEV